MTRRHIRGRILVISVLTGALVSTLTNLSQGGDWRTWAEGGLVGLAIGLTILGIEVAFGERLERLPVSLRLSVRMLLFGVGGFLGYLVGLFPTVVLVERATPEAALALYTRSHLLLGLIVTVPAALLVGGVMYTLERLRQRLAESISRLKETEFAEKELELARSIQKRLLPPAELSGDGFRVAARNFPARWVAGDFYDVFRLGDGHVGLVVADVAGKGMGASLIMASAKAVLPFIAEGRTADETLRHLSARLASELSPREFVALAYARYDPLRATLELANAGLPDPWHVTPAGVVEALGVPGPRYPLGIRRDIAYRSRTVQLGPGDRVLLFTDGLPEATTPSGGPIGYDALCSLLAGGTAPPGEWLDALFARLRAATSSTLEDDWTALVLERALEP